MAIELYQRVKLTTAIEDKGLQVGDTATVVEVLTDKEGNVGYMLELSPDHPQYKIDAVPMVDADVVELDWASLYNGEELTDAGMDWAKKIEASIPADLADVDAYRLQQTDGAPEAFKIAYQEFLKDWDYLLARAIGL